MGVSEKRKATLFDAGVIVGLALMVFGLWQIYRPLAPLVGGLFIVLICWFLSYAPRPRSGENE